MKLQRGHDIYCSRDVSTATAQHSVHPTGGSLRVFEHFSWLEVGSDKMALSRPAHQRVTQTVGQSNAVKFIIHD
jgi:hypothetical protein